MDIARAKSYCLLWLTALIRLPENFYLKTMYAISLNDSSFS